jgi:predicted DCC family thiol-disulfide oxidoreductase YuxK
MGMLMLHFFSLDLTWLRRRSREGSIVFYDGECGVCNRFVQFLLREDRSRSLHYAPLQGSTAAKLLPAADCKNLDSVVFWEQGRLYRKSSAVLKVVAGLGGIYSLVLLAMLVPRPIRDFFYGCFARRRNRFSQACRLLDPAERQLFLP